MASEQPQQPPFGKFGVIGVGLIGGSLALGARQAWPAIRIVGLDHSHPPGDAGVLDRLVTRLDDLVDCDLIVLAVPVPEMPAIIDTLARLGTRAVVTDVGSTKRRVMAAAADSTLRTFIGGHPMAGAEQPGFAHARATLFEGKPWLLVDGGGDPEDARKLERFATALGADVRWMDAETHDRTVAYVSHLPQIVATALMNAADQAVGESGPGAAGAAFAEMTRLASSPPDLWRGICAENADFVAEALARFMENLPTGQKLSGGEWARTALTRSGQARARWRDLRSGPK